LVDGVNLLSVPLPLVGGVTDVGGLNVAEGDVIYQWTGSGFSAKEFVDGEWLPSVPVVKIGEGFFLKGGGRTYVRNNSTGQNSWKVVQSALVGTGSELSVDVSTGDGVGYIRVVVE
jgi:hypothetical protein